MGSFGPLWLGTKEKAIAEAIAKEYNLPIEKVAEELKVMLLKLGIKLDK